VRAEGVLRHLTVIVSAVLYNIVHSELAVQSQG